MVSDGRKSGQGWDPPERRPKEEVFLRACDRVASERYRAFVENIEEGVYEVDIHGNFLYFNMALCQTFGFPREEIQFQNFTKFMHPDYVERAFETFHQIYETGKGVRDLVWKFVDKQGQTRIIELSANLITNPDGEKVGFRGIARDITEKFRARQALEASERRFRTLLEFLPYPVVVFTLDGRVSYLNSAFTEVFGWSLEELAGQRIPYVPAGLEEETRLSIDRLLKERVILRHETQRLTKDGRVLDVVMRGAVFSEYGDEPAGELVILRDITQEKRMAAVNEALLRISMALPAYPDLEDLLNYISGEIRDLLGVEGALVILLDEDKNELFFKAAAHDNTAAQERVKEIRFPAHKGVAGKVIRTGRPVIVPDTTKEPDFYSVVDVQAGFRTRSLLDVPLRSKDRIIGVLCAMNKKAGAFDQRDVELLEMIASTVALSIDNARYSDELKAAYREVSSLNRAKDRVINHLSHELKTPLAVLSASLNILQKRLAAEPPETWQPTLERAERNLRRILEIQYEVEDIMRGRAFEIERIMGVLLEECADLLTAMVAEQTGEGEVVEALRRRIESLFCPKEGPVETISLEKFVPQVIQEIRPLFGHRQVQLREHYAEAPAVRLPADPLRKVVVGLVRNAVENTPDGGRVEVSVARRGSGSELVVRDYGVGITEENQRRIFEGFFSTQETMDYSSKRPYDFNAGGKGADLLRMKIFSERYGFRIEMRSTRCPRIPRDRDKCPGRISDCDFCKTPEDCYRQGGTVFRVYFPVKPAPETDSQAARTLSAKVGSGERDAG